MQSSSHTDGNDMIRNSSKPSDGFTESPSTRPMTLRQQLEALFDKNTVALTKYTEEQTSNPDLPSLLEITDLDTRVVNTFQAINQLEALCQEIAREARQRDLRIIHKTIVDNDVAGPVKWQVEDMQAELTQKPPHYPNGRDEPCEICGDGGHTEIACPNQKPPQSKEQK